MIFLMEQLKNRQYQYRKIQSQGWESLMIIILSRTTEVFHSLSCKIK